MQEYLKGPGAQVALLIILIVTAVILKAVADILRPKRAKLILDGLTIAIVVMILLVALPLSVVLIPYGEARYWQDVCTVVEETQYTITDAFVTKNDDLLHLTIEDEDGKDATITPKISDLETSVGNDYLIVKKYKTGFKSYAIAYSENSDYADIFDALQIKMDVMG